jgi:hypothetical protein
MGRCRRMVCRVLEYSVNGLRRAKKNTHTWSSHRSLDWAPWPSTPMRVSVMCCRSSSPMSLSCHRVLFDRARDAPRCFHARFSHMPLDLFQRSYHHWCLEVLRGAPRVTPFRLEAFRDVILVCARHSITFRWSTWGFTLTHVAWPRLAMSYAIVMSQSLPSRLTLLSYVSSPD